MSDFNIDINTARIEIDKLPKFCYLFDLTNLIKTEACCTKNHKSIINLLLTNGTLSLQKTRNTETVIVTIINLFRLFKNLIMHV